jgi:hypothetical protein
LVFALHIINQPQFNWGAFFLQTQEKAVWPRFWGIPPAAGETGQSCSSRIGVLALQAPAADGG